MFKKVLSFGFLLIITSSIFFLVEGSDIWAAYAVGKTLLLSDKIKIKDNLDFTKSKPFILSDKMKIRDDIDFKKINPILLAEKIKIKDDLDVSITHYGTITIMTLQKVPGSLVSGTSYTITPNPKTGLGNLLVTDGGPGDEDGVNDGMIKISQIPKGRYVISQVSVQPGFLSLLGSTTININPSDLDQNVTFQVILTNTDLATLPPTPITSPSLSNTTFNQWTRLFSAIIVNNVNSSPINSVAQTPQIIIVGSQNSTAINTAINSISSVSLNASFAPLTKGSTIINTIGLENYSLPDSTSLVSVIPTILAKVNDTTDYVASTPPLAGIIAGQEMIIPVTDSLLPSFGGLKQIDVKSSQGVNSGTNNTNWFVFEVDKKIPSSLGSVGINNVPEFFVNVQHPFEETGSGFNWSDPSNHDLPPLLTLVINKEASGSIQKDSNGCPIVNGYTLADGLWTSVGISEISSRSISSSQCEITMQSQHLSKFVFSLQHFSSFTSSGSLPGSGNVYTGISQPPGYLAEATTQSNTSLGISNSATPNTTQSTAPDATLSATPNTTQSTTSKANLLQHIAQLNPLQRFSDLFASWFGLH